MKFKKDKRHGVISNIFFYFKIWVTAYPQFIFMIIMGVPAGILGVYTEITIPKLIIRGIEQGAESHGVIYGVIGVGGVMVISKWVEGFIKVKLMERGTMAKAYMNSELIFKKIFTLRYQRLIEPKTQDMLSRVKEIMRQGDRGGMHQFGNDAVLILTSILGIFFLGFDIVKIDTILLIIIILSGVVSGLYGIWSNKYQSRILGERSRYTRRVDYLIDITQKPDYLKEMKIYNMKGWISDRFHESRRKCSQYVKKSEKAVLGGTLINGVMFFIRDVFVYVYLVERLVSGAIEVSYFVFMVGLVMAFSRWVDEIIVQVNKFISLGVEIGHIREFLSQEEEKSFQGEDPIIEEEPSIEFKNVSYKYPGSDKWIFRNFNLKVASGEKIALVGNNGAGKTTLMLLLMGLLEPVEGEILIDGNSRECFSEEGYYKLFSPVFQDINVFPESIYTNIAGGHDYNKERAHRAIEESGMKDFIDELENKGETTLIKTTRENSINLSGGQNQRMLLARALYKDGKINILDEPTAALDSIAESRIYKEYNNMTKNKTSIFISHRLASTRFCNRILLLQHGKIIEEGSHEVLMEKMGKYREMFQVQSQYYVEGGEAVAR